jgi:cell division protein FtsA
VARDVSQAGLGDAATAGAVVTGGATIMEGVPELAETILDMPVRRGIPKWVGGLYEEVESPAFATAVGLVLTGARRDRPAATAGRLSGQGDGWSGVARPARRVREWLREIF